MPNFINFNGNIISTDEAILKTDNRSFQYGDGLFETIRYSNGKVLFFQDHYSRILKGAAQLKLQLPAYFNEVFLEQKIIETLECNDISLNARIKVIIYRSGKGKYEPETNQSDWVITAMPLYRPDYQWHEHGFHLGLFDQSKKSCDVFANLKTTSALIYVLAAIYKKEKNFDECIILNAKGNIADTIYANFFFAKDNKIYTPSLGEGCIDGVMRKQIIRLAKQHNIKTTEQEITLYDLNDAEEIFLSNAIKGIIWVKQFDGKQYSNELSRKLAEFLNDDIA